MEDLKFSFISATGFLVTPSVDVTVLDRLAHCGTRKNVVEGEQLKHGSLPQEVFLLKFKTTVMIENSKSFRGEVAHRAETQRSCREEGLEG